MTETALITGPLQPDLDQTERFQMLDAAINRHDSDADGPLRKGEEVFRWKWVEDQCRELLLEASDCRVAIWQLRAQIVQMGLPGLAEGLGALVQMLALPPRQLHPRSANEEHPKAAQAVALGWLGSQSFLALLRLMELAPGSNQTLAEASSGKFSLASFDPASVTTIRHQLVAVLSGLEAVRLYVNEPDLDWTQDPSPAIELLGNAIHLFPDMPSLANGEPADTTGSVPSPSNSSLERIDTRHDVRTALDGILGYYEKNEPGHPAPIFLKRVQRMIELPFEQLLHELFSSSQQLLAEIQSPRTE